MDDMTGIVFLLIRACVFGINEFNTEFMLAPKVDIHVSLPHTKIKNNFRKREIGVMPPGVAWSLMGIKGRYICICRLYLGVPTRF